MCSIFADGISRSAIGPHLSDIGFGKSHYFPEILYAAEGGHVRGDSQLRVFASFRRR